MKWSGVLLCLALRGVPQAAAPGGGSPSSKRSPRIASSVQGGGALRLQFHVDLQQRRRRHGVRAERAVGPLGLHRRGFRRAQRNPGSRRRTARARGRPGRAHAPPAAGSRRGTPRVASPPAARAAARRTAARARRRRGSHCPSRTPAAAPSHVQGRRTGAASVRAAVRRVRTEHVVEQFAVRRRAAHVQRHLAQRMGGARQAGVVGADRHSMWFSRPSVSSCPSRYSRPPSARPRSWPGCCAWSRRSGCTS
jgi:hypothetical protein